MKPPAVQAISGEDLREFCQFLFDNLSGERSVDEWVRAFQPAWQIDPPNHGFIIRDDQGQIVGGIGAIYSCQQIKDKEERFCNITSWCVLEEFRSQSMRLAMSLLAQKGHTITDFSPTRVVSESLQFLKFKAMDDRMTVYPNLPSPQALNKSISITDQDRKIEERLEGYALQVYRDHRAFPWLRHILVDKGGECCHVIYKTSTVKHLPAARLIYIGNKELFASTAGAVCNYLLLRKRLPVSIVDTRFLRCKPKLSKQLSGYIPKNFYSEKLEEADINYLYSEGMCMDLA